MVKYAFSLNIFVHLPANKIESNLMKKLNHSFLKKFNTVLVALLGLFGFSTALVSCNYGTIPCEYGVPTAEYVIKGGVVDKATGSAISGIKVEVVNSDNEYFVYRNPNNKDTTDVYGNFEILIREFPLSNRLFTAFISDIDSIENGWFNDTTINFNSQNFVQTKPGDNRWYDGEFTKTLNVELTEKTEE
jgi:putative lipoprotein (rSAM/lipoprotein system)